MLLRYEYSMAPSLANWVAGGEARCLFPLRECLELRNGLAWICPVVSSSARHLGSSPILPPSETNTELDLGRVVGDCIKRIPG